MTRSLLLIGLMVSGAACENSSGGDSSSTEALPSTGPGAGSGETPSAGTGAGSGEALPSTGPGAAQTDATEPTPNGPTGGAMPDGATGATASGGTGPEGTSTMASAAPTGEVTTGGASGGPGGTSEGGTGSGVLGTGGTSEGGAAGASVGSGGQDVGAGGRALGGAGGHTSAGGQGGSPTAGAGGTEGVSPSCIGDALPSADPTKAGPFQVAADKGVGPLAGVVPDPIYGDEQQRFNVYRPADLEQSGHCHPILIWANGYTDNPEPNPPECVVDSGANKWCGQYLPMMEHLASHGFVVVASLSTATAEGEPLPTIAGLDWILEQAEDPSSPYYQHLDTANIGQLGHSYGAMSTCMSASEPRYKALAAICGTRALSGVHTPMLFFCGGRDTTVDCSGVRDTFRTVTEQPAFFIDELDSDHGSWVYQGSGGVSLSMAAAWFRAHLMNDTESRKFFYGPSCTFCNDNRVDVEQNSLMAE